MQVAVGTVGLLREFVQKLGPYVMLEILLPGGTLVALLLFLYRRRKAAGALASSTGSL
jgi:hypothetical protein